MTSEKCKLKNTSTHPLKWQKSRILTTPNAEKDVEQQKLSFTDGGMQNGIATLEDTLAVSYKTKHILNI